MMTTPWAIVEWGFSGEEIVQPQHTCGRGASIDWRMDSTLGRMRKFGWDEETAKVSQVDALVRQARTIAQACAETGITLSRYYRWRRAHRETYPKPDTRVKDLEIENAQLRKLVADLSLEAAILRDGIKGHHQ
jgi:putative transposase